MKFIFHKNTFIAKGANFIRGGRLGSVNSESTEFIFEYENNISDLHTYYHNLLIQENWVKESKIMGKKSAYSVYRLENDQKYWKAVLSIEKIPGYENRFSVIFIAHFLVGDDRELGLPYPTPENYDEDL